MQEEEGKGQEEGKGHRRCRGSLERRVLSGEPTARKHNASFRGIRSEEEDSVGKVTQTNCEKELRGRGARRQGAIRRAGADCGEIERRSTE